jgi:hypothetical protein
MLKREGHKPRDDISETKKDLGLVSLKVSCFPDQIIHRTLDHRSSRMGKKSGPLNLQF